jgi:MraZ protein
MLSFFGEYSCALDNKGRLRLPSPLIQQLGEAAVAQGFVLNRGFEKCLVLYPKATWDNITTELQQLNLYVKEHRDFVRYFFRGATETVLDNQSRILLPQSLLQYADLEKEAVLFAYFNRIEIWDQAAYDNLLSNEPSDFSSLAEIVMGKINGNTR